MVSPSIGMADGNPKKRSEKIRPIQIIPAVFGVGDLRW